jgi:hypothetical protein
MGRGQRRNYGEEVRRVLRGEGEGRRKMRCNVSSIQFTHTRTYLLRNVTPQHSLPVV